MKKKVIKTKKEKTPKQIFASKLEQIKDFQLQVFTSTEKLSSILAIGIYRNSLDIYISDCERKIHLSEYFEDKQEFITMRNRLMLFRDEFSKACEYLDAEIERLEIKL